ncbi:MAG: two-component system OmpR family response regulator [Verrucomicrobiales bacterium]|jgi:two-component system OmpR family response regulator
MRALIVEDDPKIASFLTNGFGEAGFVVDSAMDGLKGLELALSQAYDVAIIDLMLPKVDGLSLIEKIRADKITTPVIILSARDSVDDRIQGLRTGGDDYMSKPFSFGELLARVQAVIRRSTSQGTEQGPLRVGDLELDPWKREVRRDGEVISLHAREFTLLEFLMRHPSRVLSKTAILENVYDYNFDPQTNVVDVLVHRLRKKVDEGFDKKLIHTLRGMGYVLRED